MSQKNDAIAATMGVDSMIRRRNMTNRRLQSAISPPERNASWLWRGVAPLIDAPWFQAVLRKARQLVHTNHEMRTEPMADSMPQAEIDQLDRFLQQFSSESDRGAALTAGAMLEDRLGEILRTFLVDSPEASKLLDGFNAPLGTLSARILAACSLGLIDDDEYREMQTIRRIRNKFAHEWSDLSFEAQSIKDLCSQLPWRGAEDAEADINPRGRFNLAVAMLITDLLWRTRLVKQERRESKSWPNRTR